MKKKLIIVSIIIIALILLIPIPMKLKDGGSIEFKAILYKITKYHRLSSTEEDVKYIDGIAIEILGKEIYNNTSKSDIKEKETFNTEGVTTTLTLEDEIQDDTIWCGTFQLLWNDLKNNLFRLHVIANSDSKEDQNLKYIVRDNLLDYMNSLCANCSTKEEAISIAKEHINDFEKIATNTIIEHGYSYNISVEIGNFEFPTKQYGDISLPAGYYDALRVKIGESKGQNWWCVMFPPLCFVDVTSGVVPEDSKKLLKENLSEEDFTLISDNSSSEINFKFKLLEIFSKNNLITAKNN